MTPRIHKAPFDDRFLQVYAGYLIMSDPKVALTELIANAWDASATRVEITYPNDHGDRFAVGDNGHGMSKRQFHDRFMKFGYRRLDEQGQYTEVPSDVTAVKQRRAFGKNAKGKHAAFLFGRTFRVRTWRDGIGHEFEVSPSQQHGLIYSELGEFTSPGHGTEIYVEKAFAPSITEDTVRTDIGMRFLSDPSFEVFVNGKRVSFSDIPEENLQREFIEIDGLGRITATIINTDHTDRTTHHHGIAWWVDGRLVGECTWKGTGHEHLFDGRRTSAKRYTFIVEADFLNEPDVILPDWTAFNPKNDLYIQTNQRVGNFVRDYILELSKETRAERFDEIKSDNNGLLKTMTLVGREKWEEFVQEVQRECQSISDDDLGRLAGILAKMEVSDSKYGLLQQLAGMDSENLDELNNLLCKWDIDLAKIVLDELQGRLTLLEQLRLRVANKESHEVLDLQPLFYRGLWIFGPEYETIEFTSNQGMTTVVRDLFGSKDTGSLNRPDFVVIPDGTVGLYSVPKYDDEDGEEIGPDKLTIVELKKPGVRIGKEEKDQPFKYAAELDRRGLIKPFTQVSCFVLGDSIDPVYARQSTEWDGRLKTRPLDYNTVINRAKSRSLNLYEKVKNAPFLKETKVEEFLRDRAQSTLNFAEFV